MDEACQSVNTHGIRGADTYVVRTVPNRLILAVFAVALVSFVALLGATVVLWDLGPTPEYTY